MDEHWSYKNFNMVVELDIAGEFIYNGIHEIYRVSHFANDGSTFTALYDTSVGIERLQKIVYVLWGMDDYMDEKEFEKSLITHSHTDLRDKIIQLVNAKGENLEFCSRENAFFNILDSFYNHARYMKFNVEGDWNAELKLLRKFVEDNDLIDQSMDLCQENYLIVSEKFKEIIGRTIGSIAHKYYRLINEGSNRNTTYTYELRSGSKAEKVFAGEYKKNSLMREQLDESVAFKELLVFFRKMQHKNAFIKFIDEIKPLDFDPGLLVEYLENVIKGDIPQTLIDDVEYMYGENGYSSDRIMLMDAFANSNVWYEYPEIEKAGQLIAEVISNPQSVYSVVPLLKQCKEYISGEEIVDTIDKGIKILNEHQEGKIDDTEMVQELKIVCEEYQEYLINNDMEQESEKEMKNE